MGVISNRIVVMPDEAESTFRLVLNSIGTTLPLVLYFVG